MSNVKSRLGRIFTWEGGQRLFNFAYSVGAAIVIWGALFKILHLPGGNTLLCIGMGTEVLMFILTAFDRPPREYKWENVYPQLKRTKAEDDEDETENEPQSENEEYAQAEIAEEPGTITSPYAPQGPASGPTAVQTSPTIGGIELPEADKEALTQSIERINEVADQMAAMADLTQASQQYLSRMAEIANQMEQLRETTHALNEVSNVLLSSYKAITDNSADIAGNSRGYIDQMNDLNRNIGGLNTIYEIQLKSVSSQLDSIDRVNRGIKDIRDMYEKSAAQSARYCEETEKMAVYMQQLNNVYEKMLHAMTVNMYRPMVNDIPGAQSSGMSK